MAGQGRPGRPRKDGRRLPCGALAHDTKIVACACGRMKTRVAAQCRICHNIRRSSRISRCACGTAISRGSVRCVPCQHAAQRLAAMRTCEWCGRGFYKRPETKRFCSNSCSAKRSAAIRFASTYAARAEARAERAIQQAIQKAAENARRVAERAARPRWCRPRAPLVEHVCPCCGLAFMGTAGRAYCSKRCRRGMRKYSVRLNGFTLDDRNKMAELLALLKAYNRRINTVAT